MFLKRGPGGPLFVCRIKKEKNSMDWDEEAEQIAEMLPIPPMMGPYARLQAEKIARHNGLDRVTVDAVRQTEDIYREFIGDEKTEQLRAFIQGTGPAPEMEDELFFENEHALYNIEVCFTKYGENTKTVREALKDMKRSVELLLEEENVTEIMADLAPVALHGASRFNVVLTGCPNCCVSPYMRDFGIIMQHKVDITDQECTRCGKCLTMCIDNVITLTEKGPDIDVNRCALCELCARDCPTGTLVVQERGFQVVTGGTGGRHPRLAVPVESFVTKDRVLAILRKALGLLRTAHSGENLGKIIERDGIDALR